MWINQTLNLDMAICGRCMTEKLSSSQQKSTFANQHFLIKKKCCWQIYVRLSPLHYLHSPVILLELNQVQNQHKDSWDWHEDYLKRNERRKETEKNYCCIYNPFTDSMPTAIQLGPQETQLFFSLGKCFSIAKKILIQSSCRTSVKKTKPKQKNPIKSLGCEWGTILLCGRCSGTIFLHLPSLSAVS